MIIEGINGVREEHDFIALGRLMEEWVIPVGDPIGQWQHTSVQRPINAERVGKIAEGIRQGGNVQGTFSFTVAVVEGKRHLVDGQHRLAALQTLVREGMTQLEGLLFHVRTIQLPDMTMALKLTNELGDVAPVDPVGTIEERACLNKFDMWFRSCINKPTKSQQPHYGNYSIHFVDTVTATGFFGKFDNASRMMAKCQELNLWVFHSVIHISRSQMKNVKALATFLCPDTSRFETKTFQRFCEQHQSITGGATDRVFCLHMIVNYGFVEIVKYMYDLNMSPEEIFRNSQHKDTTKRLPLNFNSDIDKNVSKEVVRKFFTEEARKCPICQSNVIQEHDRTTFALGHIIAHARGGTNTRDNLIPICHRCNLDCRAENLRDYCRRLYGREF
jgi:hypothetical protein